MSRDKRYADSDQTSISLPDDGDCGSVSVEELEFNLEEALNSVDHGLIQKLLLVLLGLCCSTFSANVVLMSYLEPNVKCLWDLSKTQETILSVAVFMGMIVGSSVWGSVADRYGRKLGTSLSLLVEGIAGLATSASTTYWFLLASRAVVGIGVGGLATSFSTYSEFLPTRVRGYSLCWYQLFWAAGVIAETALGWALVPPFGWRALALATALPSLFLLPLMLLLPESPRYLAATGRKEGALRVLCRMAAINGTSLPSGTLGVESAPSTEDASFCKQLRSLFVHPLHRITPLVWFLAFTLGLGYYGTVILTAEVRTDEKDVVCVGNDSTMDNEDYASILIDACAELPGVLLALFTIERLGRVRSILGSWIACWISMALLALLPSEKTGILFVARFFTVFVDVFIFIFTSEIYPSSCRCLGTGAMSSVSQLGGVISPFIARSLLDARGLRAVSSLCGAFFFAASICTFFLIPYETAGRSLRENLTEPL